MEVGGWERWNYNDFHIHRGICVPWVITLKTENTYWQGNIIALAVLHIASFITFFIFKG